MTLILNVFKIVALFSVLIFILFFNRIMVSIHQFLEITSPIEAKILVVEGWLDGFDYTLPEVVREYKSGSYDLIVTTSVAQKNASPPDHECAEKLRQLGIDSKKITSVTAPYLVQYKTYGTALAVRDWLIKEHPDVHSINLISGATHGRKSFFLYKKAFEGYCDVGVISLPLHHIPMGKWWRHKRDFIGTIEFFVGYFYTFIKPDWPKDLETLSQKKTIF